MGTSRLPKGNPTRGKITIRSVKRQIDIGESLPSFEVQVQVELDGHKVAWTMTLLPGAQVPIQFDESQEVILIAHDQELLVDSSRVDKSFSIVVQEAEQ